MLAPCSRRIRTTSTRPRCDAKWRAVRFDCADRTNTTRRERQGERSGGAPRPCFSRRWAAQSTYVPGIVHVNPLQAGQLLNDGVHIAGTCGLPEQEAAAPGHRQRQGAPKKAKASPPRLD